MPTSPAAPPSSSDHREAAERWFVSRGLPYFVDDIRVTVTASLGRARILTVCALAGLFASAAAVAVWWWFDDPSGGVLAGLVAAGIPSTAYAARALHAGASGYVLKDCAGTELIAAVDSVARGGVFFSAPITRVMLEDYIRRVRETGSIDRFDMLSPREREIFQLIAEGRTNKEVAALLDISAATVETHRARILQKLDLHNAAELVLYAARRGVVT